MYLYVTYIFIFLSMNSAFRLPQMGVPFHVKHREASPLHRFQWALLVSVGPGETGGPSGSPQKQQGFIISPRLDSAEDEMMILDNFNQIQGGSQRRIGIFGSQKINEKHKEFIELLCYALVLSGNHIVTSGGGTGTNYSVIKGALRACNPDLLTVILPQTMMEQPPELQNLLSQVVNLVEQPEFVEVDFKEAVNVCNENIKSLVDELLVFAFHDSDVIRIFPICLPP